MQKLRQFWEENVLFALPNAWRCGVSNQGIPHYNLNNLQLERFASHKQERWVPNNDLKNHTIQPRNVRTFQMQGRKLIKSTT